MLLLSKAVLTKFCLQLGQSFNGDGAARDDFNMKLKPVQEAHSYEGICLRGSYINNLSLAIPDYGCSVHVKDYCAAIA